MQVGLALCIASIASGEPVIDQKHPAALLTRITTSWSRNGVEQQIGELSAPGVSDPYQYFRPTHSWSPRIFLSHRGPDTKETIVRPTDWFLSKILRVDSFFDANPETGMIPSGDQAKTLLQNAHLCNFALVVLSPHFRESKYCVMELNTLMHRWDLRNVTLLPALWEISNVDGYASDLNSIIWLTSSTTDPAAYLVDTLWPSMVRSLGGGIGRNGRPEWSDLRYGDLLAQYVQETSSTTHTPAVPASLLQFAENHHLRVVGEHVG